MKKLELLAPAGNEESFNVALNNGADAIYLGLGDFNARGNIENFNYDSLRNCVKRAHMFGKKVYLTLNILIFDSEIEKVLEIVRKAIEIKIDAFIVQDIGLCYMLRNKFPEIELHASTQMGISNLEGASFLADLGFKRLVLSRETPLEEIRRIKENLDIEIEYFVQGALCVGYSGNCYLCSLYAGASGNRGKCKQFCRLPFVMKNDNIKKEGYLLSTKDFCMLPVLKDLAKAGVTSFKIEGRARRPAYVGGAVKVYRDAIDNDFKFDERSLTTLKKLFNRGDYISGYLKGENIIYNKTQNHKGIKIGKVISFKQGKRFNEVIISSNHNLQKGDALKFFVEEKECASVGIQDVKNMGKDKYLFTTTTYIPKEALVHLIVDSKMEEKILAESCKIEVRGKFEGKIGQRARLTLSSGNIEIEASSEELLERANSNPMTADEATMQISKMGEDFMLNSLEVDIENIFMAKSQINKLRREAIEKLRIKLIEQSEANLTIKEKEFLINNLKKNKINKNNKKIIYFKSLKSLEKSLNSGDYLVFDPDNYNEKEITDFCQKYKEKTIYLSLPVIAEEQDIKLLKSILLNNSNLGVVANNYYACSLTSPNKTIIGSEMNVANSYSVAYYESRGYDKIVLTKENFDIENITSKGAELFVETEFCKTLMHFKHCPFKENLGGDCSGCRFKENTRYCLNGMEFVIRRKHLKNCQFELIESKQSIRNNDDFGTVMQYKCLEI